MPITVKKLKAKQINNYRKSSKILFKEYMIWRENTPWENHSCVSFIAGFNAAINLKKNKD